MQLNSLAYIALWPCVPVGPWIDSVIKCVLSWVNHLSIVLSLSCVFWREEWSLFLCGSFGCPRGRALSQPADSLSRCSSTDRPCHCYNPPLLCPAPLSTSLPTPYVLLFLCRCWDGSPLDTTQWQNSSPIYISISLLIYLFIPVGIFGVRLIVI